MTHAMLDLETFGAKPGCVVRSLGAVVFDPATGVLGSEFYANLTLQPQLDMGLEIAPETEKWWLGQGRSAQDAFLQQPYSPLEVVAALDKWIEQNSITRIWSHGKDFDPLIWVELVDRVSKWHMPGWVLTRDAMSFRNTLDTRTIYWSAQFDIKTVPFNGVKHNALDDAKYQAVCVAAALKYQREWHEVNGLRKAIERQVEQEIKEPMNFGSYEVDIIVRTSPAVRKIEGEVKL